MNNTIGPFFHFLGMTLVDTFSSGLAAIDAIIKLLSPGDEVISTNDLYGGTFRLFTKVFEKYGVKFHFTSLHNVSDVESLINENTKVIWAETPTNPMINIFDIDQLQIDSLQ